MYLLSETVMPIYIQLPLLLLNDSTAAIIMKYIKANGHSMLKNISVYHSFLRSEPKIYFQYL